MPEISRFNGIVIQMFFLDHGRPHFHAKYQGRKAKIEIETLEVVAGDLPGKALADVRDWAKAHEAELLENWRRTGNAETLLKIEPLN